MYVITAGFAPDVGVDHEDTLARFEENEKAANDYFDTLVAEGEYHYVYLSKVKCDAVKTYDVTDYPED
jgi:hypothetical protein